MTALRFTVTDDGSGFDTAATTLRLPGGVLDSAVGLSFHQIAMAGRSLHHSQDMGRLQQIGPSTVRLALLEDRTGRGKEGLFAGVDTMLPAGNISPPDLDLLLVTDSPEEVVRLIEASEGNGWRKSQEAAAREVTREVMSPRE